MDVLSKVINDLKIIYQKTGDFNPLPIAIVNDQNKFILGKYEGKVEGLSDFFVKLLKEHNAQEVVFLITRKAKTSQGSFFGQVLTLLHYNSNNIFQEWQWAIVDYMRDGSLFKKPIYKSEFWDKILLEEIETKIDINKKSRPNLFDSVIKLYQDHHDKFLVKKPDWLTAEDIIKINQSEILELKKVEDSVDNLGIARDVMSQVVASRIWLEIELGNKVSKEVLDRALTYHQRYSIAQNPWTIAKYLAGEILDNNNFHISNDQIINGIKISLEKKEIDWKEYSFLNNV